MGDWETVLDFLAKYISNKNMVIDYLRDQLDALRAENDRLKAKNTDKEATINERNEGF